MLVALNDETRLALGNREYVELDRFPFRIGRECRSGAVAPGHPPDNRRSAVSPPTNECYLLDFAEHTQVSRLHLQIERDEDQVYFVVDRGSACGTRVDGESIGSHRARTYAVLEPGMEIHVGTRTTPYRFRFTLD